MAKRIKQYQKKQLKRKEIINEIKFCIRKKDWKNALVEIDDYLSEDSTDHYVLILKAMTLFRNGQKEEAMQLYEEILSCDLNQRNELFAHMQYAHALLENGQYDSAIEYYNFVIEKSKDLELIARGKLSSIYCKKRDWQKALEVLEIDGYNDVFLNNKKAEVYEQMGQYAKALEVINQRTYNLYHYETKEVLDSAYIEQEMRFIIGNAFYKMDRFEDAQKYLAAVQFLNCKLYFEANIRLVKIYTMKGFMDEAIKLSDDVIKKCDSTYYIDSFKDLKAFAYLKKGDYKKAEEIFSTLDKTEDEKNIFFAKIDLLKGNFEQAEEKFSSFDIEKENINARNEDFYKLLLIKFRLGKYDEADQLVDKFYRELDKERFNRCLYEVRRLKVYMDTARNIPITESNLSYSERQIISYNEEKAIKHITLHHSDNPRISKFYDDIDINQLFVDIKDMLNSENKVYESVFDKYIIKYKKAGVNLQNGNIHEIHVLTLPDTKDIITMYPYDGTESIFYMEEEEVKEKPKTRRLTQTEKFYNKYGKKA